MYSISYKRLDRKIKLSAVIKLTKGVKCGPLSNNKRFFFNSKIILGKDKFLKIIDISTKVLSKGFSKKQLKDISSENKEEVMQSINHYQGEIEGKFKINNGDDEHTAFIGITHSRKHDVKDDNNFPVEKESFKITENLYVGPELRLIKNKNINKDKLYNGKSKIILLNYKEKIENKINEIYSEGSVVPYIKGIKDNKINEGIINKYEKESEIYFNLNEINESINKIEKFNKD